MTQTTLGERLRIARKRRKMTLAAVAKAAGGGSASQIHAWENGQDPSSDNLTRVCLALGVSGHWLLTGDGPMYPEVEGLAIVALQEIAAVVDRYRLSPTQAEGLAAHLEALRDYGQVPGGTPPATEATHTERSGLPIRARRRSGG